MSTRQGHTDLTREFYDLHVMDYIESTHGMEEVKWLEAFVNLLPSGAVVLDAGCAGGRDSAWLKERGVNVSGLDLSPKMIAVARERVPGVDFRVGDIRRLPYPDNSFHGIWACCVLIHVHRDEVAVVLDEFARCLKPGGAIFILVKEGETEGVEPDDRCHGDRKFSSYFKPEEIIALSGGYGFVPVMEQGETYSPDDYRAGNRIFFLARLDSI